MIGNCRLKDFIKAQRDNIQFLGNITLLNFNDICNFDGENEQNTQKKA